MLRPGYEPDGDLALFNLEGTETTDKVGTVRREAKV
jgi:hypothetical protein